MAASDHVGRVDPRLARLVRIGSETSLRSSRVPQKHEELLSSSLQLIQRLADQMPVLKGPFLSCDTSLCCFSAHIQPHCGVHVHFAPCYMFEQSLPCFAPAEAWKVDHHLTSHPKTHENMSSRPLRSPSRREVVQASPT